MPGLHNVLNSLAALAVADELGVPTDIAPQVERAMNCLDNVKWWGVPQAARAVVWSIIPGADAGKPVYYLLRWVGARGEKGPWSETETATIAA